MKALFLMLFIICCVISGKSQENATFRITSQSLDKVVTFTSPSLFLDSTFHPGMVFYKSGEVGKALMKFNLVENDIYFIKGKGDVLKLNELDKTSSIKYAGRTFVYTPKYNLIELIKSYSDSLDLFIYRQSTVKNPQENDGAYSTNTNTSALTRNSSYEEGRRSFKITRDVTIEVTMKSTYLLRIKGKYRKLRNVQDLIKIFPHNKQAIEDFVRTKSDANKSGLDVNEIIELCIIK